MQEWTDKLSNWLKKGKDDSNTILDMPWEVTVVEGDVFDRIQAHHPRFPFPVNMAVSEGFVQMVIDPNIPTDSWDATERMRVYKKLLITNLNFNLIYTALAGDDNAIVVACDFDLKSLGKAEFNDGITFLLATTINIIDSLGLGDHLNQYMYQIQKALVMDMIGNQKSDEEILKFLTVRIGLEEEYSKTFLKEVRDEVAAASGGAAGDSEDDQEAVDRYIQ